MIRRSGTAINNLIAFGPVKIYKGKNPVPERLHIEDIDSELKALEAAILKSKEQLSVFSESNKVMAEIMSALCLMLEDEEFVGDIKNRIISEKVCAAYAAYATGEKYSKILTDIKNDFYMNARAADVIDVSRRIVANILDRDAIESDFSTDFSESYGEKYILVADDLGTTEMVNLDRDKILAIVTLKGSTHSHMAILAKSMGIPGLVATDVDMTEIEDGAIAIVDGLNDEFVVNPDERMLEDAVKRMENLTSERKMLESLKGVEIKTNSGKVIKLYANINSTADVKSAIENDAEGIGLFRSEFLYIGRDKAPTEEDQFEAYRYVLEKMGDKPVIIRTMDLGADKEAKYLNLPHEYNPALGFRAIRICLAEKELFKTQLRALLRAACYGNLRIMYPMITSEYEIDEIKTILEEAEKELKEKNIEYRIPLQGIMIETPAAVMISESLATRVDFFSIGSNDLAQYTLAADRQNENVAKFYNPYHPAILTMIKMVCENAHKAGIPVGICGELASDANMTKNLIDLGLDELSVPPHSVLKIRAIAINN